MKTRSLLLPAILVAASCASSNKVDMEEPRRLLGREENVRIDAQIIGDRVTPNSTLPITYEIQNLRDTPIAVADVVALSDYDPSTRTISVTLGAEVPGNEFVPRLILIGPGEKKSFSTGARTTFIIPRSGALPAYPQGLRIRVNYLRQVEPFQKLVGIPEKAINDPAMAAQIFPHWVENNESVTTNTIPIRWGSVRPDISDPSRSGPRRRGGF
jgi:hypothetical protein